MRNPTHGKLFGFFYVTALLLILAVFGGLGYLMITSEFLLTPSGSFNAPNAVILIGGGIVALALLTAVFYFVAQIDTRLNQQQYRDEEVIEPTHRHA